MAFCCCASWCMVCCCPRRGVGIAAGRCWMPREQRKKASVCLSCSCRFGQIFHSRRSFVHGRATAFLRAVSIHRTLARQWPCSGRARLGSLSPTVRRSCILHRTDAASRACRTRPCTFGRLVRSRLWLPCVAYRMRCANARVTTALRGIREADASPWPLVITSSSTRWQSQRRLRSHTPHRVSPPTPGRRPASARMEAASSWAAAARRATRLLHWPC